MLIRSVAAMDLLLSLLWVPIISSGLRAVCLLCMRLNPLREFRRRKNNGF